MTPQEAEARVREKCHEATGTDTDDVFYDPSLCDLLKTLSWCGVKWECLPGKNVNDLALWPGDEGVMAPWSLSAPLSGQTAETKLALAALLTN
jgi:hypothetical protein